mgnify:CR=1 FL=1
MSTLLIFFVIVVGAAGVLAAMAPVIREAFDDGLFVTYGKRRQGGSHSG